MGTASDEMKTGIGQTREKLVTDVDRLADRTSPRRIAQRRANQVRGAFRTARERVMGTADHATSQAQSRAGQAGAAVRDTAGRVGDTASNAAQQATEVVKSAPEQVRQQTQGNPLAAGLIAFGVGALAGSLIPMSRAERQAADQAEDVVQPVKEAVGESARRVADEAKTTARESGQQVADAAREGARTTGQELREQARSTTAQARAAEPDA
jgi:ElaB/YqjD/DUF883 family membrane-anchored ribosome-binding protein